MARAEVLASQRRPTPATSPAHRDPPQESLTLPSRPRDVCLQEVCRSRAAWHSRACSVNLAVHPAEEGLLKAPQCLASVRRTGSVQDTVGLFLIKTFQLGEQALRAWAGFTEGKGSGLMEWDSSGLAGRVLPGHTPSKLPILTPSQPAKSPRLS